MKRLSLCVVLNCIMLAIALVGYNWISSSYSKWNNIDQNPFELIQQLGINFEGLTIQTQLLAQKLNQLRVLYTLI